MALTHFCPSSLLLLPTTMLSLSPPLFLVFSLPPTPAGLLSLHRDRRTDTPSTPNGQVPREPVRSPLRQPLRIGFQRALPLLAGLPSCGETRRRAVSVKHNMWVTYYGIAHSQPNSQTPRSSVKYIEKIIAKQYVIFKKENHKCII